MPENSVGEASSIIYSHPSISNIVTPQILEYIGTRNDQIQYKSMVSEIFILRWKGLYNYFFWCSPTALQPFSANTDTTGFWKSPGPNGSPAMASPWVFVEVMHKAKNCLYFWIAWHASSGVHSASSSSLPWLRYASILGREAQISTWPGGLSTKSGEHPGLPFTYLSHGRVWHHRLVDPSLSRHVWNIWPRHTYPGCRKPRPSCGRPLHQRISKREMDMVWSCLVQLQYLPATSEHKMLLCLHLSWMVECRVSGLGFFECRW